MKKQPKRIDLLFLTLLGFTAILIFMADNGTKNAVFQYIRDTPYGDKVVHFLLFGTIAMVANMATQFRQYIYSGVKVYQGTSLVSICVLVEEISQIYIPSRTFDWYDILADIVGITLFTLISYLLAQRQATNNISKEFRVQKKRVSL